MTNETYFMAEGEKFLAHYGVPGMKWGRRKARAALQREKRHARGYKKATKKTLSNLKSSKGKVLLTKKGRRQLLELDPTAYRYNRTKIGAKQIKRQERANRLTGKIVSIPIKAGAKQTRMVQRANEKAGDLTIKGLKKGYKAASKASERVNSALNTASKHGVHIGKTRARNARLRRDFKTATGLR